MKIKTKITGTKSVLDMLKVSDHRAMAKASTNTGGGKTFIQARRAIKKQYNVRARLGDMPFDKKKATAQNLTYSIGVPTRMFNIGALFKGAKQTKAGVKVHIRKGARTLIKGAFVARPQGRTYKDRGQQRTVKSNNDLVLRRETGSRSPYPLEGIGDKVPRGIGWATMILNSNVQSTMTKTFQAEYDLAFSRALTKRIKRKVGNK